MQVGKWVFILTVSVAIAAPVSAECSRQGASWVRDAIQSKLDTDSTPIVTFKSSKQFQMTVCESFSDGYYGEGVLSFYGTDGAYYWVKGKADLNSNGYVISSSMTDANANFITLAAIKGVAVVVAGCTVSNECN
ncbi:hypothetical protein [Hyphomonas sp.]|uniref:hypothetical protein n=1 Tax=Hyphomonas sp. TaxID=87 RepID=UPI0025C4062E|nr:hypothetical protein [Hyphomonas sp.]